MDLEYTVTENIHRDGTGHVVQIDYQFEETVEIETPISSSTGISRQSKEKRSNKAHTQTLRQQPRLFHSDTYIPCTWILSNCTASPSVSQGYLAL